MPVDCAHWLNLEVEPFEHNGQSRPNFDHRQRRSDTHARACSERQIGVSRRCNSGPAFGNELVRIFIQIRTMVCDVLAEDDRRSGVHSHRHQWTSARPQYAVSRTKPAGLACFP